MKFLPRILDVLRRLVPRLGPYLMLELILPGGTLLAALLFLYRRGRLAKGVPAMISVPCPFFNPTRSEP